MKFEIRDTFPVSPEVLFESLIDAEIETRLASMAQAERELLEEREEGDVLFRRLRYTSGNPAFSQLARLLGSDKVTYEQHLRIHRPTLRVTWEMIPPAAADRLKAEGAFWVVAHAEGSERLVEGNVSVKIPLVGGTLEGRVVDAIKKIYSKGTQFRREYLAARG